MANTVTLGIEKILVWKDSSFCWIKCKPFSTKQLLKNYNYEMASYAVVYVNVGVFTTIFDAEPFKIKPDGVLNISNFIKQNTKVEGNICQLLF